MANEKYALEWLELAIHNLEAADLLFNSGHYTDVIGIEIHQAIEKTIKAVYAYNKYRFAFEGQRHEIRETIFSCSRPVY